MKKAIRFSIVVWLFSWAVMGAAYWGLGISPKETPEKFRVLATICVFFPMLTALVLQAIDKEKLNKAAACRDDVCMHTCQWSFARRGTARQHSVAHQPTGNFRGTAGSGKLAAFGIANLGSIVVNNIWRLTVRHHHQRLDSLRRKLRLALLFGGYLT